MFLKCFLSSLLSKKFIIHVTGGCNYMILAFPFKKRILTIHDLFHFGKKKQIKGVLYDFFYYKLPIYFSHKIIVVSQNTERDLVSKIPLSKKKIKVLLNPIVLPQDKVEYKERIFSKSKTIRILQIGDKPLKNFERLIEATKDLNVFYNFVHSNDKLINSLIEKYSIANYSKVHSNISDDELIKQYKLNDVLFFASEEEGFGLPIIEAQLFGMPVITSNFPPMNEVGEGAIFVDSFSVLSIKDGFLKLYDDNLLRQNYEKAHINIKKYDLTQVGKNYFELYKRILL
ncbi:MAG: glycosyltransferase family 4 protein [Arcobacter sp.]|nr:glycosyltransferase family 4 protein [Arcobacter sp.]